MESILQAAPHRAGEPSRRGCGADPILAGLVNAAFEDWMVAVGYYMCIIFWVLAFSLRDWMDCPAWPEAQKSTERPSRAVVQHSFAIPGQ